MAFRLKNERIPDQVLIVTNETWFRLLDVAEEYGWNPMGTVWPGVWDELEVALAGYSLDGPLHSNGHGPEGEGRLVLFEDALNLADALEQAFIDYEPRRVPASFFLFEPADPALTMRPSIGAMASLVDFCRSGGFWIERHHRIG